jgi:tetratricopeptide (TPR) repeat protein
MPLAIELAQQVVADERLDRWTVLDLLGHLVDKSLVVAEGASVPRYRLLETTRAYALEQLAGAGETAAVLRAHAVAIMNFFAARYPRRWMHTMDERAVIGAEIDNLRIALEWARDADPALACDLAGYGYLAWVARGLHNEGIEACLRVLPVMPKLPLIDEARFRMSVARLGYIGGRRECFEGAKRAAELLAGSDAIDERVDALCYLTQIGSRRGERDIVEAAIADAVRLLPADAPPRQAASLALSESMWHQLHGRFAEAKAAVERQAAIYRANGDAFGVWLAESNASFANCGLGEYDVAIERLQRALVELRRMGAPYGEGQALGFLAVAHAMRGDVAQAIESGRASLPELAKHGSFGWMLYAVALAHAKGGAHERAAMLLGFVDAEYARLGRVHRAIENGWVAEIEQRTTGALGGEGVERLRREGAVLSERAALSVAFDASRS